MYLGQKFRIGDGNHMVVRFKSCLAVGDYHFITANNDTNQRPASDCFPHLFEGDTQSLQPDEDGGYTMTLPLPLVESSKIELFRAPDEITLGVGTYRRNIVLPRVLWPLEVESAKLDDGVLRLRFAPPEPEPESPVEN